MAANIFISNSSLDIVINDVYFNGVQATYAGGVPLPNQTGDGTNLETTQVGTYTLDVYYSVGVPGQNITITDSDGTFQCYFFGSSGVASFINVNYDGFTPIYIYGYDGACSPPPTPTETSVTPTPTPTIPCIDCQDYYNNSGPLTGFYYYDCNGVYHANESLDYGGSICVSGGLTGPVGFLTLIGTCGTYCPGDITTPTPTPDSTPPSTPDSTPPVTPTPTPICSVVSFNGFSGLSLNDACAQLYPITIYYCGSLGVGTDLYADASLINPVNTPGYYNDPNNLQVYHVGLPSVQDGRVTDIQYCLLPTPTQTQTPTETTPCSCTYYDVIVTNNDIDSATGNTTTNWNNTVWAWYYDCNTGFSLDMIFYSADPYYNTLCNNNIIGVPYLYYHINDVPTALGITSTITNNLTCCTVDPTPTNTQTPSETPTQTPTNTETPTQTPTPICSVVSFNGFSGLSLNDACAQLYPLTIYYCGSLGVGTDLYADASLINPVNTPGYYNDPNNLQVYHVGLPSVQDGRVTDIQYCTLPTPSPTQTPSETPTQTPTLSPGASPYPTTTPTPTPSETPSETPPVTPSETPPVTPSETPPVTPSETPPVTPSETPPVTPSETPSETPTPTQTPTPSITASQTQTPTPDPTPTITPTSSITASQTQTPTPSITASQTQTPTPSITASPTPTPGFAVQFVDCSNSENIFRFNDPAIPSTIGVTYYITGSTSFDGCATTVVNDGSGPQYNGAGVSFLMTGAGCGDPICPRSSNKAALLTRCSDGEVFYFNVEEDTAFVGAAYVYDGVCYGFVEFSGPGGDNIGSPLYQNCFDCLAQPTPTPTPYPTPTNTPTVSSTPPACIYTSFCLSSTLSSVINYNGNYDETGFYNGKPYYVGDGATTGYIYYVTGSTEYWCLSSSLGGTCILQGASPCYSQCPDILANGFTGGICPTPTPTPINCNTFNFNAYFDCDWEPLPTPTPSVACDDVNFDIGSIGVTPTPSPTGIICDGKAVTFSMSGYTPAVTPTIPLTPTVTITRTVDVAGQATFNMLDETFSCVSVKVLTNCNTGMELYTSSNLSYNGITVVTGMTFFALINNENVCVTYTRNDTNFSSNSIVNQIFQIYSNCANCSNVPTPTPSVTTTPTQTPSATAGLTPTATATPPVTPTQTLTQTPTPSPTSTLGSTPTETPSNTPTETPPVTPTQTQTASNTPTPSITKSPTPTPVWVYVYQSCQQIQFGKFTSFAQVIQTQQVSFTVIVGESFKDDQGNCWVYNGRFEVDYIAPPTMTPITFQGNYFANAPSTVYTSCDDCLTPVTPPQQTVTGAGGYMQPCLGGTIDDYMGASVILDTPVTVDTTVEIIVYYQYRNSYISCSSKLSNNNSTSFGVFIPAGESYGAVDACTQGQYFSTGANICGACIIGSDNPNINFGTYGC